MTTRGERRAQKATRKRWARRLLERWGFRRPITGRDVGIRARTPQLCSCMGCGNARPHEGPTLQERRHEAGIGRRHDA